MNHSLKISLMALVAMFAFNTTADAQFGGLLKKAKQAVSSKPKESCTLKNIRQLCGRAFPERISSEFFASFFACEQSDSARS